VTVAAIRPIRRAHGFPGACLAALAKAPGSTERDAWWLKFNFTTFVAASRLHA